jgi:uncharacterized membrane protein
VSAIALSRREDSTLSPQYSYVSRAWISRVPANAVHSLFIWLIRMDNPLQGVHAGLEQIAANYFSLP